MKFTIIKTYNKKESLVFGGPYLCVCRSGGGGKFRLCTQNDFMKKTHYLKLIVTQKEFKIIQFSQL